MYFEIRNNNQSNNQPVAKDEAESRAYQAMIALKGSYPEGMRWTNANYYRWNGGIYSGGYGCMGFAFILSDAAFDDLPTRKVTNVKLSDVRMGDILRIDNDVHSVIVFEVYEDSAKQKRYSSVNRKLFVWIHPS